MLGPILGLLQSGKDTFVYDDFSSANLSSVVVTVGCVRKAGDKIEEIEVSGFLSGELEWNIDSKWDPILGGQGTSLPGEILDTVDLVDQMVWGGSIRQPWFSRAVWRGNVPLALPITMQFMAQDDAKTEVWDPLWNLAKLFLPRLKPSSGAGSDAVSQGVDFLSKAIGEAAKNPGIASVLRKIIGSYEIPGPSTFFPLNSQGSRPMFCRVGQLAELSLEVCYFTDLKVKMPLVFNASGYPTYAEASFVVHSMDSMYIDENGQLQNSLSTVIQNEMDAASKNAAAAKVKAGIQARGITVR